MRAVTNRHGRRGLTIRITALAALLAATAAVPARAATLGQLTPLNCFSTTAITGCESQPGLNAAGGLTDSVAVSPDGQSLYAIMSASTLVQFAIQADGSLAYVTCIGDATLGGANPCPVQAAGIKEGNGGGGSVVVSPDGASLYVSGYDSNSVAAFRRDTSGPSLGHLTSDGCLANTAVTTCDAVAGSTHGQAAGLDGPEKIALSPDGANLYVPAISSHTITVFKRQTSGVTVGKLTPDGCLAYTGTTTCDAVGGSTHGQAPGVEVPDSVAISADGGSVYVTDALEAVAVFIRDTSGPTPGRLTSDGCLASAGTTKCDAAGGSTHGQVPGLTNPHDVVVSSDGVHVYVGGQGTLTALKRDASGATPSRLVSDGCLAVTGLSSCDGVSGSTSGRAQAVTSSGLALSPDGKDLYTSDYGSSR